MDYTALEMGEWFVLLILFVSLLVLTVPRVYVGGTDYYHAGVSEQAHETELDTLLLRQRISCHPSSLQPGVGLRTRIRKRDDHRSSATSCHLGLPSIILFSS